MKFTSKPGENFFNTLQAGAAANGPAVTVCVTPGGSGTEAMVNARARVRTRTWVHAYRFTSAPMANALVDAQTRGVRVEALLD